MDMYNRDTCAHACNIAHKLPCHCRVLLTGKENDLGKLQQKRERDIRMLKSKVRILRWSYIHFRYTFTDILCLICGFLLLLHNAIGELKLMFIPKLRDEILSLKGRLTAADRARCVYHPALNH